MADNVMTGDERSRQISKIVEMEGCRLSFRLEKAWSGLDAGTENKFNLRLKKCDVQLSVE